MGKLRVRITSFREINNFASVLSGAYYVFESKRDDDNVWTEIMVRQYDDPIEIDSKWVNFDGKERAAVFFRDTIVSTDDDGKNWRTWKLNAIPELARQYCFVTELHLEPSQRGKLIVSCGDSSYQLVTADSGESWKIEVDNQKSGQNHFPDD
jgi:photosystem II stability/assembly factor-like uncharacterized protein